MQLIYTGFQSRENYASQTTLFRKLNSLRARRPIRCDITDVNCSELPARPLVSSFHFSSVTSLRTRLKMLFAVVVNG